MKNNNGIRGLQSLKTKYKLITLRLQLFEHNRKQWNLSNGMHVIIF